jgi:hypothetical protein
MSIATRPARRPTRAPWNKGRLIGQKRPLLPKHVWSIRVRLEMADNKRDLVLFNMAIERDGEKWEPVLLNNRATTKT